MSEKASTEFEYSFAPPSSTWGGGGGGGGGGGAGREGGSHRAQLHIGWHYHRVYQVSMRCSTSP